MKKMARRAASFMEITAMGAAIIESAGEIVSAATMKYVFDYDVGTMVLYLKNKGIDVRPKDVECMILAYFEGVKSNCKRVIAMNPTHLTTRMIRITVTLRVFGGDELPRPAKTPAEG